MKPFPRLIAAALAALALPVLAQGTPPYDYPTLDRVRFVQECMAEHPGPSFEMTSKCVCVLDALREQLTFEQFVSLSTAAKATSIGGERGGYIRDSEQLQGDIRRWRALMKKTKEGCFIRQ